MRMFVLPWFIFINTYGCIALPNQLSESWFNGSKIPMFVIIPILFVTNLMAGLSLKKPR